MVMSAIKVIIKVIAIAAIVAVGFVFYCNIRISTYSKARLYDDIEAVPHYHTALVLGTSPMSRFGGPNGFFVARISAAVQLYEAGKVDRIIVSGDNRRREYNDSVVRAKEVFGQDSFIVVSQKFHNERAVFIAGLKDIDAVGFNAADIGLRAGGVLTHVREWGARCKVFLDMISGRQPHFLGDPIDIG